MANLDELQIKITASSKEADEAIKSLTNSLNSLNDAIGRLDGSKVNSFASAIGKLSNIGANTSTTAKAIKGMASDLSSSFGIRTKKGVEEVTAALQALYTAARNKNLNDSPENDNVFWNSVSGLQKVIEENYRYKESVDETSKSIAEYIRIQNQSGRKVAMGDMAKEYGDDFKAISNALGKSFKNHLKSTEGAQDLAEFFNDMNSTLHTSFKTDSPEALKESLESLIKILDGAKEKTYKFSEAVSSEMLSGSEAADAAYSTIDRIFALIKEQDKYGASSGLGSLVEVFKQIGNIQMPDMSGVADALKAAQTASNNVSSSSPKVEEVAKAMDTISQSASNATSNANELGNALMVISQGFLATTNNTTSLQVVEQALPALREMSNFQPPDISTAIEQFNEYADAIYRALAGMRALEDKRPGLSDKYYDPIDTTGEWISNNPPDLYTAVDSYAKMQQAAEGARQATERLGDSIKLITDKYYDPIDSNGVWVDPSQIGQGVDDVIKQGNAFEEAANKAKDAAEKMDEAKGKASGNVSGDVLENVVALGEAFEKLSAKLNAIGDKGIKLFKTLTTPLKWAAEEYKEKFENIGNTVQKFQKNFQKNMAKMSQFWKRTMKTFTFMLVRKAITAIIKEVGNAVQSLAMYSNAMGTAFNTDISHMVADFQYLGRSIVSVFAPLLSYIAPIIDAIVDRIATLISYIGMLFAALGGGTSFTKAKKNVGNYAESLDQASKSAKNLTMGIDELNILSEGGGGGGAKPYDGWEDAWEDVEIPKWITDLADKIKKMWDDFIRPIKAAWDKVKEYFKFAFNYMKDQVGKLAKSIWDAFIQVWNEPETIEMIANIFRIIADLMIVIGNLAKNFREAWDEVVDGASRGVQIFRGIRDIFAVLIEHVRNVTWYMVRWSSELNFRPLLDSIITLLHSLYDLADFLGGVFEDVMKNVVLKYIKWLIEEGIPHLNRTIAEVIDAFDFDKIRQDLVPVEDAFERLLEHIEEGTTNAMGNLGKQIAEFANSQEFTDFMQRIADIMDLLSAEDVEKILTGIGQGILSIAESVVKFINSDAFMSFLEGLDKWLENASSEDIAGILKAIATAIGIFKFGAFVGEGLAGFFKFATILVSLKNLHEIASGLTAIGAGGTAAGTGATAASGGLSGLATVAAPVVAIILGIVAGVYSLVKSYDGLSGVANRLKESVDKVTNAFKNVAEALKLDEIIQKLKDRFKELTDKLGNMKDYWELVIGRIEFMAQLFVSILVPAIEGVVIAFTAVIDVITGVIDMIGGLASVVKGFIEGVTTGDWSKVEEGFSRIGDGLVESFINPFVDIADGVNKAVVGGVEGIGKLIYGEVDKDIKTADWEKIPAAETVGKGTATGISNAYKSAAASTETTIKETTKTMLSNGLGVAGEVDYAPMATTYNQKILENLCSGADTIDWASYGTLVNTKTGEELVNQSQPFDAANVTTATTGAETFTSTYADYFNNDTTIQNALEQYGAESGKKLSDGFNTSVTNGNDATTSALLGWFGSIKGTVDRQLDQVKALFQNKFNSIFTELDVTASITTVFTNITNAVTTNMNALGENLLGTLLPSFMETYIFPFFNLEMWQPLFDNLMNVVFLPFFEQFRVWFMEEAMTPWWEEDLLSWFADDKWNEEIFMPLHENIQENWDLFSSWWDTTMNAWWEDQVLPWFDKPRWEEQFNKILEVVKKVFDLIKQAIKLRIDEAKNAVLEACEEMKNAIEEVMTAIDTMMEKLSGFEGFNGDVTFSFGAKEFASGGFPAYGSLFVAGEPGAGTEWVGNVGGRTGVVSNNEITGIADAVYATGNAETELLGQLLTIGRAMLDKDPIIINDKDIARMANRGQNQLGMSIIS